MIDSSSSSASHLYQIARFGDHLLLRPGACMVRLQQALASCWASRPSNCAARASGVTGVVGLSTSDASEFPVGARKPRLPAERCTQVGVKKNCWAHAVCFLISPMIMFSSCFQQRCTPMIQNHKCNSFLRETLRCLHPARALQQARNLRLVDQPR